MDQTAIKQIQQSEATAETNAALRSGLDSDVPLAALHKDFSVANLEPYMPYRTRFRGKMSTAIIDDFVRYVKDSSKGFSGPACFINPNKMSATAIFNLGNVASPGHADFTAQLSLEMTAEFKALLSANGQKKTQKDLAEWAEDWRQFITFYDQSSEEIDARTAIGAIRRLTIESSRKVNHEVGDFNANRSALESIEAKSDNATPPASFTFTCNPYNGLPVHSFSCRISILTSGDTPMLSFRIKQQEYEEEQVSLGFLAILQDRFVETDLEIYRGEFNAL